MTDERPSRIVAPPGNLIHAPDCEVSRTLAERSPFPAECLRCTCDPLPRGPLIFAEQMKEIIEAYRLDPPSFGMKLEGEWVGDCAQAEQHAPGCECRSLR